MTRIVSILAAAAVFLAAGLFIAGDRRTDATGPVGYLPGAAMAQQAGAAPVDISTIQEMTLGAEDAPITMVEYASFTCPHCARFHAGPLQQIKSEYIDTGKVRLIFRDVYFDRFGLWASMVARCAGPDRFFGVADLLFEGQQQWTHADSPQAIVDELKKIGRVAGMDDATLEACLQDGDKARTLVAWFQDHAARDDVRATPSFVIDGEKVSNQPYEDFKAMFDAKLGN